MAGCASLTHKHGYYKTDAVWCITCVCMNFCDVEVLLAIHASHIHSRCVCAFLLLSLSLSLFSSSSSSSMQTETTSWNSLTGFDRLGTFIYSISYRCVSIRFSSAPSWVFSSMAYFAGVNWKGKNVANIPAQVHVEVSKQANEEYR